MNFEDFKEEIYTMLGDSMTEVELNDTDLSVAFRRAKRTFQQKGPNNYRKGYYCFTVSPDKVDYFLPKEVDTAIKIIRPDYTWWSAEDPLALAAYNNLFAGMGTTTRGDWLSLEMLGQQLEIWNRYAAQDIDFNHDKMRSTLRLLQPPRRSEQWILEVYSNLTDEEYMEMLWIQSWAITEAKIILGAAYRKFSSLPSPDGSSVSLSGDQMIQEAKEEQRLLLEDIENQVSGDVDWYGVYIG